MSIVIFGDSFTFPEGTAATNRVYTYAKGLRENGVKVHVICSANHLNLPDDGIIDEIPYYNPYKQRIRSNYFVVRRWKEFTKNIKIIKLIRQINDNEKINTIIVYTHLFLTISIAWYLAKICKAKLVMECNEHPLKPFQKNALHRTFGLILFKIESFFMDSVFCISQFLIDYHKLHGFSPNKLFLIPSTVDPSRFIKYYENPLPYEYIGYFGGLTLKRDNIRLLIDAFSKINEKYPDIHLVLGGFGSEKEKEKIKSLIWNLDIESKVLLLDYLPRNEIIRYLTNSKLLVMVRGNDMESQASFPSKLTEYLCTSIPVIAVSVGEISRFLTDGINSFLIEPDNMDQLINKVDFILNNYAYALEIAKQGNELTSSIFNYNFQTKRMINFLQ